jgi:DNA polymerase lambda
LVFWATMHMKIMQQRVQDFGGTLQKELTAATTHIVCPPHLTAKEAAVKLACWTG